MIFFRRLKLPTKKFYYKRENISVHKMSEDLIWIPNLLAMPLGADIFSDDFNPHNLLFYYSLFSLAFFTIAHIYAMFLYSNDTTKLTFTFATFGLAIQTCGKLYTFLIRRPDILKTLEMCRKFVKFNNDEKPQNCFEKWLIIGFNSISIMTILFFMVGIFIIFSPVLLYFMFGTVSLIVGTVIPYTDPDTKVGYIMNYIIQVPGVIQAVLTFLTAEMDVVIFLIHCLAFNESLECLIDDLQFLILQENNVKNKEDIQLILKKLIEGHNLCYEFLDNFESSFQFYHMIEIGGAMYCSVISLFAITKVGIIFNILFSQ